MAKALRQIGAPVMRLPPMEKVRDLEYFEGPLLCEFRATNGDTYLYSWRDADNSVNRWMVFRCTRRDLTLYTSQRLTFRELVDQAPGFVWLADFDNHSKPIRATFAFLDELPPDYLPAEGALFDPALSPTALPSGIVVNGNLGFAEINELPRRYRDVYGFLFFYGRARGPRPPERIFNYKLDGGGYVYRTFFNEALKRIPPSQAPDPGAIQLSSPGIIEVKGNAEISSLVVSAVAQFHKNYEPLSENYRALDSWVHDRKSKNKDKQKSQIQTKSDALTVVKTICELLGFLDFDLLYSEVKDTRVLAQVVLAYYRRVEDLARYEDDGLATIV